MKKKLAAVALAVALVSLAVPALAFAGGYGQAADGARQARGACFALCQATEALGRLHGRSGDHGCGALRTRLL